MLSLAFAAMIQAAAPPQPKAAPTADAPIEQVMLSPLYGDSYMCSEHYEGQLKYAGDALGQDCMITGGIASETEGYAGVYRNTGAANEDWYGWGADVLAHHFIQIRESVAINTRIHSVENFAIAGTVVDSDLLRDCHAPSQPITKLCAHDKVCEST